MEPNPTQQSDKTAETPLPAGIARIQKLVEPVDLGDGNGPVTELRWRKWKGKYAKDLPASGNLAVGQLLDLAADLCGVAPAVVGELGAEDFGELMETVVGFLRDARLTGPKQ